MLAIPKLLFCLSWVSSSPFQTELTVYTRQYFPSSDSESSVKLGGVHAVSNHLQQNYNYTDLSQDLASFLPHIKSMAQLQTTNQADL
jgi:hypothetical protein